MTLQQLKYVIAIAEKGSINEAAKVMYISQPSLTNAMHDLENDLGIQLFIRNNKGIRVTNKGEEFLRYARQVIEQVVLLEDKYLNKEPEKQYFHISAQHYNFAVRAFIDLVQEYGPDEYDLALSEKKTYDIIEDVKNGRSEWGILYLADFNKRVIMRTLKEYNLTFTEMYTTKPYIFISARHPLADRDLIRMEDLEPYPYIYFEQGESNSFYFAEEVLSTFQHKKSIRVTDRATCFNLILGLNGYTPSAGIYIEELGGGDLICKPLALDETIHIGAIAMKDSVRSEIGRKYLEFLKKYLIE